RSHVTNAPAWTASSKKKARPTAALMPPATLLLAALLLCCRLCSNCVAKDADKGRNSRTLADSPRPRNPYGAGICGHWRTAVESAQRFTRSGVQIPAARQARRPAETRGACAFYDFGVCFCRGLP